MTYFLHLVSRDELPEGHDWLYITEPDGDLHFLIARDVDRIAVPMPMLCEVLKAIGGDVRQAAAS